MPISDTAQQLLILHAGRPDQLFYGTDILGSLFRPSDIELLDEAYQELVAENLMEPAGPVVSFFGDPKRLYRLTDAGIQASKDDAA